MKKKQRRLYTLWRGLQRDNRRKRRKKLETGKGEWEKKIQRQGGKCRGEETDGIDRRKWMRGIEREPTRGRRKEMDLYRQQGRNSDRLIDYGIVNEEAWERVEEFRIGERVESDPLEITLRKRKGGKNRRKWVESESP
jgi:hypothetical protein